MCSPIHKLIKQVLPNFNVEQYVYNPGEYELSYDQKAEEDCVTQIIAKRKRDDNHKDGPTEKKSTREDESEAEFDANSESTTPTPSLEEKPSPYDFEQNILSELESPEEVVTTLTDLGPLLDLGEFLSGELL